MSGKNTGLTEIPITPRGYRHPKKLIFDKGDVRKAFERVFSPDAYYVLFQTVANKEAVDALRQYPGASDKCRRLQFDNDLMDLYQSAIDRSAEETIGAEHFSHYPMVLSIGVHSLDRDPNAIFWPTVYLVNKEKQEILEEIINNLSGDKSFEVLRMLASPQFYRMAEIEILHKLGIPPLVILPNKLTVSAQDLSNYVDFLAQMIETCIWTGPVMEVD